jgi:hypothetical protein
MNGSKSLLAIVFGSTLLFRVDPCTADQSYCIDGGCLVATKDGEILFATDKIGKFIWPERRRVPLLSRRVPLLSRFGSAVF